MPVRSDDPLRRVTLNLYDADCQWLEKTYGRGWTERVRQHIHSEVIKREVAPCSHTNSKVWFYRDDWTYMICNDCNAKWIREDQHDRRKTLGDLDDKQPS